MDVHYVVRHKRASSFYFSVMSILRLLIIFLCGYVKCSMVCKGDGLRLTICVGCSWEKALNVCIDMSFDNT
jgi:hypothetical protein